MAEARGFTAIAGNCGNFVPLPLSPERTIHLPAAPSLLKTHKLLLLPVKAHLDFLVISLFAVQADSRICARFGATPCLL
jgi:hypothetical protein